MAVVTRPGRDSNGKRPYQRHGLTHAMQAVRRLSADAIDGRTRVARAAQAFRESLLFDLGGEKALSTQELTIVDLAVNDVILLGLIDGFVYGNADLENPLQNVLSKKHRRLYPIVEQRQGIATALTAKLAKLGIERRVQPVDLGGYVAEKYGTSEAVSVTERALSGGGAGGNGGLQP